MIDIVDELNAIHREVGTWPTDSGENIRILLRRSCPAVIQDVWDAVAAPDRIRRWFLPEEINAAREFATAQFTPEEDR